MGRDLRDAWAPFLKQMWFFELSAARPDVAIAKSRDPYSMWTGAVVPVPSGSVCGHAHTPSIAHATDVVIQVVSNLSAGEAKVVAPPSTEKGGFGRFFGYCIGKEKKRFFVKGRPRGTTG